MLKSAKKNGTIYLQLCNFKQDLDLAELEVETWMVLKELDELVGQDDEWLQL